MDKAQFEKILKTKDKQIAALEKQMESLKSENIKQTEKEIRDLLEKQEAISLEYQAQQEKLVQREIDAQLQTEKLKTDAANIEAAKKALSVQEAALEKKRQKFNAEYLETVSQKDPLDKFTAKTEKPKLKKGQIARLIKLGSSWPKNAENTFELSIPSNDFDFEKYTKEKSGKGSYQLIVTEKPKGFELGAVICAGYAFSVQ